MSAKTLLTLSASLLLGAVIAAPSAALAQFGPPPVLRPCSPVLLRVLLPGVLLRVSLAVLTWRSPGRTCRGSSVPWRRGRTSARSCRCSHVWMVRPDRMVSIAANRPVFAASKLAPRANGYTRNSYASYGYGHGYGRSYRY